MTDLAIIPALDLKGGHVVQGSGGDRAAYLPIETPLGPAGDAIGIARGLLALTGAPALYVADLDAIEGIGNHFELCRDLSNALPHTVLWIDAGFSNVTDCAFWLPLGATLVIGTESLRAVEDWQDLRATFGENLILSLDYAAYGRRGPGALFAEPAYWPERIIVMSLDRVGTGAGPDIDRLRSKLQRAGAVSRACLRARGARGRTRGVRGALLAAGEPALLPGPPSGIIESSCRSSSAG